MELLRDENDRYVAQYQVNDIVVITDQNSASNVRHGKLNDHSMIIGREVLLTQWDPEDGSWLVRYSDDEDGADAYNWIHEDCLNKIAEPTEEEVQAAIASITASEHPDLIRLRERERLAVEQGYTKGDVNHYVQPIIGQMRMALANHKTIDAAFLEYAVDRLAKACNAELAWLHEQGEM